MMEQSSLPPKKQEITVIEESKANANLQINVGLRQTRKIDSRQESQNRTQQDDQNETHKPFKKKIPGAYHEKDEVEEEIRVLIPRKYKKTQEGKEVDNYDIEIISQDKNKEVLRQDSQNMELKNKVKSTANDPKLEKEVVKSVNTSNIKERLLSLKLQDYDTPRLHYACPLGFMEVFILGEEYPTMALVDTGSEINIIPEEIVIEASLTSRKLNMNLRGIGGHTTSLVGLSKFTPITLMTGEEKEIHLFIAKVAVHTILGRPFLADNNVKLEFSHKQGEIFSYPEQDGC
ncbi:hypothetical protein O181_098299 [Austropuccinia psidii MF-1]|uniref:Peptidase A2 domain-containing protein n=1 Tax=Austropuccinia psidii MF-1 TaxID=1389203 RepID=A0A9Q3JAI3_9BASI|nr:hypothetical protein [Austropuccinia psidii MF-1]